MLSNSAFFLIVVCIAIINGVFGELYRFTGHTFTPAGATGRFGPTLAQIQNAYSPSWAKDARYLSMPTPGYQHWVVPATGKYRITANGAAGGEHSLLYFKLIFLDIITNYRFL